MSDHDKDAWEGTEYEQFGGALHAAIALYVAGDGLPLVDNGQRAGCDKRLAFVDEDPLEWSYLTGQGSRTAGCSR